MWSKNILYNWNYSKLIWLKIWSLFVSLPYAHKKNIQSEENELLYKPLLDQVDFSFNIFCIWTEFFLLILSITEKKSVNLFNNSWALVWFFFLKFLLLSVNHFWRCAISFGRILTIWMNWPLYLNAVTVLFMAICALKSVLTNIDPAQQQLDFY